MCLAGKSSELDVVDPYHMSLDRYSLRTRRNIQSWDCSCKQCKPCQLCCIGFDRQLYLVVGSSLVQLDCMIQVDSLSLLGMVCPPHKLLDMYNLRIRRSILYSHCSCKRRNCSQVCRIGSGNRFQSPEESSLVQFEYTFRVDSPSLQEVVGSCRRLLNRCSPSIVCM